MDRRDTARRRQTDRTLRCAGATDVRRYRRCVSLHDSAIAILRRFGQSAYLRTICERAIIGEAVLCIGASEESGGSDLQIV